MDTLSVYEIARETRLWANNIYTALATGQLPGTKDPNGKWRVSRRDFEEWMRKRRKYRKVANFAEEPQIQESQAPRQTLS